MPKRCQVEPHYFRCEEKNGWHIIHVAESVDFRSDFSDLEQLVARRCTQKHPKVALTFDRKSYLHSRLIALLVACSRKARERGGVLALIAPEPHVLSTLRTMKLVDQIIKVFPSENDLN